MSKLIAVFIFVPLIFFTILLGMIFIPVKRESSGTGLNFDVLVTQPVNSMESQYMARDGQRLFYRYLPGSKALVVMLLHGSGTEGRYLLPLAERLNRQSGATVIVPDLRGHGRSILSRPGDIAYRDQFDDDIIDLQKKLAVDYPNAKWVLGGHSSGGGLAIRLGGRARLSLAENMLPNFDAYVLLAPYLSHDAPTVRTDSGGWVQVSVRRIIAIKLFNMLGVNQFNGMPVLFFNRPKHINDAMQLKSYSYRLMVSFSPENYQADLQANNKPILLWVGDKDEAFYPHQFIHVMHEHASQAQVKIAPNITHLALPGAVLIADDMASWLKQLSR
ncbi:alpha/beta fold hydrolase [uncultured Shewanella sp.]|uniref:alpha/beta hydrolase n=1 Tax=uncultured Shewanella sp. TaxID=173975 RepID=UPI002605F8D5|nr:alpha/beta fold hydrolase [uncultured Shewanella sp.]